MNTPQTVAAIMTCILRGEKRISLVYPTAKSAKANFPRLLNDLLTLYNLDKARDTASVFGRTSTSANVRLGAHKSYLEHFYFGQPILHHRLREVFIDSFTDFEDDRKEEYLQVITERFTLGGNVTLGCGLVYDYVSSESQQELSFTQADNKKLSEEARKVIKETCRSNCD